MPPSQPLQPTVATVVMPFIGRASYKIRQFLLSNGVAVYFKSSAKLGSMLYRKLSWDAPSSLETMNAVYYVRCADCRVAYVGETSHSVRNRARQHNYAITRGDSAHSGLAAHCIATGHSFVEDDIEVIDRETRDYRRKIKESLHILARTNLCNVQSKSVEISPAWLRLCGVL